MQSEAEQLINWLKAELSEWFTAEADGALRPKNTLSTTVIGLRYFVLMKPMVLTIV